MTILAIAIVHYKYDHPMLLTVSPSNFSKPEAISALSSFHDHIQSLQGIATSPAEVIERWDKQENGQPSIEYKVISSFRVFIIYSKAGENSKGRAAENAYEVLNLVDTAMLQCITRLDQGEKNAFLYIHQVVEAIVDNSLDLSPSLLDPVQTKGRGKSKFETATANTALAGVDRFGGLWEPSRKNLNSEQPNQREKAKSKSLFAFKSKQEPPSKNTEQAHGFKKAMSKFGIRSKSDKLKNLTTDVQLEQPQSSAPSLADKDIVKKKIESQKIIHVNGPPHTSHIQPQSSSSSSSVSLDAYPLGQANLTNTPSTLQPPDDFWDSLADSSAQSQFSNRQESTKSNNSKRSVKFAAEPPKDTQDVAFPSDQATTNSFDDFPPSGSPGQGFHPREAPNNFDMGLGNSYEGYAESDMGFPPHPYDNTTISNNALYPRNSPVMDVNNSFESINFLATSQNLNNQFEQNQNMAAHLEGAVGDLQDMNYPQDYENEQMYFAGSNHHDMPNLNQNHTNFTLHNQAQIMPPSGFSQMNPPQQPQFNQHPGQLVGHRMNIPMQQQGMRQGMQHQAANLGVSYPVGNFRGSVYQQAQQTQTDPIKANIESFLVSMDRGAFDVAMTQVTETVLKLSQLPVLREKETKFCAVYMISLKIILKIQRLKAILIPLKQDSSDRLGYSLELGYLSAFLTKLPLINRHKSSALQTAIERNMIIGNYGLAAYWIEVYLETVQNSNKRQQYVQKMQVCRQHGNRNQYPIPENRLFCYEKLELTIPPVFGCLFCNATFSKQTGMTFNQICTICRRGRLQ